MGAFVSGLQEQSLEDLVALAQRDPSDSSAAMSEIVRRFQRTATRIVISMTADVSAWDDMRQMALIAVMRAVRRHQQGRAGLATYIIRFMRGAAHREMCKAMQPDMKSLSDEAVMISASAVPAPVAPAGQFCWGFGPAAEVVSTLPERQQHLLTDRYVHDAPLASIAMASGTSVPAVSQRLATAHRAVKAALAA